MRAYGIMPNLQNLGNFLQQAGPNNLIHSKVQEVNLSSALTMGLWEVKDALEAQLTKKKY